MTIFRALLILSAAMPAAAVAAPGAVHRLSDGEVEQVLADAAAKREASEAAMPAPKAGIHGSAGVAVGTGGYRAAYGTAFVPLGEDAGAVLSFSTATENDHRRRVRN